MTDRERILHERGLKLSDLLTQAIVNAYRQPVAVPASTPGKDKDDSTRVDRP